MNLFKTLDLPWMNIKGKLTFFLVFVALVNCCTFKPNRDVFRVLEKRIYSFHSCWFLCEAKVFNERSRRQHLTFPLYPPYSPLCFHNILPAPGPHPGQHKSATLSSFIPLSCERHSFDGIYSVIDNGRASLWELSKQNGAGGCHVFSLTVSGPSDRMEKLLPSNLLNRKTCRASPSRAPGATIRRFSMWFHQFEH